MPFGRGVGAALTQQDLCYYSAGGEGAPTRVSRPSFFFHSEALGRMTAALWAGRPRARKMLAELHSKDSSDNVRLAGSVREGEGG